MTTAGCDSRLLNEDFVRAGGEERNRQAMRNLRLQENIPLLGNAMKVAKRDDGAKSTRKYLRKEEKRLQSAGRAKAPRKRCSSPWRFHVV